MKKAVLIIAVVVVAIFGSGCCSMFHKSKDLPLIAASVREASREVAGFETWP